MKITKINNDVIMCLKENSNIYDMLNHNDMICIHENEVNKYLNVID